MIKSLVVLLISLVFYSCSTPRPEGQTEAEVLFREAEELVSRKRFIMASEKLSTIRSQHPYSIYATRAELLQANILYDQSNFSEAAAAYILFRDFHPRHEQAAFVIWRIGESFYNQLPSTYDRDLTAGDEALRYYRELIRQFSGSEFASTAMDRIETIEKMNVDREKYVADFYFRTKVYDAARLRYLGMIESLSDEFYVSHAKLRALESSLRQNERSTCESDYQSFLRSSNDKLKVQLEKIYNQCLKISDS
jgi:outer membrane protein assembly factor BamD